MRRFIGYIAAFAIVLFMSLSGVAAQNEKNNPNPGFKECTQAEFDAALKKGSKNVRDIADFNSAVKVMRVDDQRGSGIVFGEGRRVLAFQGGCFVKAELTFGNGKPNLVKYFTSDSLLPDKDPVGHIDTNFGIVVQGGNPLANPVIGIRITFVLTKKTDNAGNLTVVTAQTGDPK